MHYLYKTPLLKCMEDWLDSYDVDLLTTGVLALGNFARTDTHCIEMVERNIPTKLLGMKFKRKFFFFKQISFKLKIYLRENFVFLPL